jgi:hypothetical protein
MRVPYWYGLESTLDAPAHTVLLMSAMLDQEEKPDCMLLLPSTDTVVVVTVGGMGNTV